MSDPHRCGTDWGSRPSRWAATSSNGGATGCPRQSCGPRCVIAKRPRAHSRHHEICGEPSVADPIAACCTIKRERPPATRSRPTAPTAVSPRRTEATSKVRMNGRTKVSRHVPVPHKEGRSELADYIRSHGCINAKHLHSYADLSSLSHMHPGTLLQFPMLVIAHSAI